MKISLMWSLGTCVLAATAFAANPLVVKTDKGKVEGALTVDQQVRAFKGIPYAAPPVGELRWQPPQPAAKWKGVREAKDFGARCMQTSGYSDMVFHDSGESEDCLTLNVWTPVKAKGLPVMVWIYGGGFVSGGTSEARQDGQYLAHRGVVVVSMNYRLGIFGFFAHPELTAESPNHASGNYGLMDQTAALRWVKENIAAFGGDPNNVTIFGESAGSISVSMQMASPLAQGLFQKAIGESGGAFSLVAARPALSGREATERTTVAFAERSFGTSKLADLRKLSADELVKAAKAKGVPSELFWPDVDGYFLPESVRAIYAAGRQAHVPLLAGWNKDEARGEVIFARPQPTAESFRAEAEKLFGAKAEDFLKVYPAATDAEAVKSAGDLAGDRFIVYSTWRWLESQVETGGSPVYRYRLDLGSPGDKFHPKILGAFHSDDIEYVFGTLDSRQQAVWRPEDRALSDQMQQYWTNFAKTGDPNGTGLPKWPVYNSSGDWQVMHLNATSEAKPDDLRARYLFLDSSWGKAKE
ncbi:carboxylesterase/lipase family protein [Edaphobacter sp.]|uniref:carboxylesterase/lipase family protein n=1 Tax=Edaphobacter sp. TaxID=1934404 RepID=UPI002DB73B69|nr:carboxylesterase/lipase family protein [Edaphobacter sp.]HEU5342245.1 carboxylesterase/lipase family protein [Edaphobacter sp.]